MKAKNITASAALAIWIVVPAVPTPVAAGECNAQLMKCIARLSSPSQCVSTASACAKTKSNCKDECKDIKKDGIDSCNDISGNNQKKRACKKSVRRGAKMCKRHCR